ncbi:hypothetical protein KSF_048390 [Reticulibacter mediterranei]|uniref:Saccharopine dehydrogenase NADP binding domain-containing protein n=1 Tax=Reticulibacter mediterranei TaxID=2778369 RepID=A0A8J3IT24_9CHLR|nr:hypothetical protein [Reticulibacter mediterranei]GHO94791.1 hypothetical protein KSF_048390 [Reticulibacter mediterranei]
MQRIFFVGLGDVGANVFDLFLRVPGQHRFLIGGRKQDYLQQRTNLSLFAAMQFGLYPEVELASVDLMNVEHTAEVITQFQPDIIFCAATLQKWGVLNALPKQVAERLYQAQIGPWLPLHLTLVYKLMLAVQQTGLDVKVMNATYPDVVHAILNKVGLAPTTGIGDIANNIPALKKSLAIKLSQPVEKIDVRLVAQHHVHYWASRKGTSDGAPFHLSVTVDGQDLTQQLTMSTVFDLLPGTLKRTPGNQMTATSAAIIFDGMVNDRGTVIHAPGPNGLPGAFPVKVNAQGVEVVLPNGITLTEAVSINTTAQQFDGIEHIDDDGTVHFSERHMAIFKKLLGYECRWMPLSDVEDRAKELRAKYTAFARKYT